MAISVYNVAAGATGIYSGLQLIRPTISGNNSQTGQGPYDSRAKRIQMAAIAGLAGAATLYVAPAAFTALAGASTFKTGVAVAALVTNAPSAIKNIYKGDERRPGPNNTQEIVGPYSTFTGRALGHAQEAVTGAALAYLAYNNPETMYLLASTATSGVWETTKFTVSTTFTLSWETTKLAANGIYYGAVGAGHVLNSVATVVNAVGNATSAVGGLFSAGYNAFFGGNEG